MLNLALVYKLNLNCNDMHAQSLMHVQSRTFMDAQPRTFIHAQFHVCIYTLNLVGYKFRTLYPPSRTLMS